MASPKDFFAPKGRFGRAPGWLLETPYGRPGGFEGPPERRMGGRGPPEVVREGGGHPEGGGKGAPNASLSQPK